jgi:hypothetical protein
MKELVLSLMANRFDAVFQYSQIRDGTSGARN